MLSSRAQSSKEPTSRRPGRPSLPGVAPRSVRTGLRSRVPALVAGTPARCSGLATQRPPVPRQPSHASSPGSQPRLTLGRGPLPPPGGLGTAGQCSPARWPSSLPRLSPRHFPPPRPLRRTVAARRSSAPLPWAPKDIPGCAESTLFMLQCCTVSATEGEKRPGSQTKHKNWCVTHLLGYLPSPNCLPGVFLAEAAQCVSLFFLGKMD